MSPPPLHVAFLWHMHQPYYRNDRTGEVALPWVRMHAVKDYTGMALLLAEHPDFRCTVNFAPSLLFQLQEYAAGRMTDRFELLARAAPAGLSPSERAYVLEAFFWAHPRHMIGAFPRYAELLARRDAARKRGQPLSDAFADREILDLAVLWNLAWCHRLLRATDALLSSLCDKGRDFSERDRDALLDRQREIAGRVIPRWKALADSGQVELSTSPYYHPILPILCRPEDARAALPKLQLPSGIAPVPEDAAHQIRRGLEEHARVFGSQARGMWPSEGSVSDATAALAAANGFRWIASDEEILSASLGVSCRAEQGRALYRPWAIETPAGPVACVFRDHQLSDLIGFAYQERDPAAAAEDLVTRIFAIGKALEPAASSGDPVLVPIILDGENAWESYIDGGVPFLRALFSRLSDTPGIRSTTMSGHLDSHPPRQALRKVFPGSWIRHDFAIWIGHEEDHRAWVLLHQARKALLEAERAGRLDQASRAAAWEEVYQAEGSDWYWWFGMEHQTASDLDFDRLFRAHVANIYALIGVEAPAEVERPIKAAVRRAFRLPTDYLQVLVDGRVSDYFEWMCAGSLPVAPEAGAMDRAEAPPLAQVLFGFNESALFLRADPAQGARGELRFEVQAGTARPLVFDFTLERRAGRAQVAEQPILHSWAVDRIVEVALPLEALGAERGTELALLAAFREPGGAWLRFPADGPVRFQLPTRDLRRMHWVV